MNKYFKKLLELLSFSAKANYETNLIKKPRKKLLGELFYSYNINLNKSIFQKIKKQAKKK